MTLIFNIVVFERQNTIFFLEDISGKKIQVADICLEDNISICRWFRKSYI